MNHYKKTHIMISGAQCILLFGFCFLLGAVNTTYAASHQSSVRSAIEPVQMPQLMTDPVYGYYEEVDYHTYEWMHEQLPVFAAYGLTLYLGLPDVLIGDPELLQLLQDAAALNVDVRAWVLLPIRDGYWANDMNAEQFASSALRYAEWFLEEDLPIRQIVVDMELDIYCTYHLIDLIAEGKYLEALCIIFGHQNQIRFDEAVATYQEMVDDLHDLGFSVMVVTYPMVLDDMEDGDTTIQDLMNIPVSPVVWDEVSTMVYTTEYEAITGLDFSAHFVYDYGLATVQKFGTKSSIALGVSGTMTDPQQLADEIAAAKAAGIFHIQVYSHNGAFQQENPELWHQAFGAEPAVPPYDPDTTTLRFLMRLIDYFL